MGQNLYIGLLSGTSADAIDAAIIDLSNGASLIESHTKPIPENIRQIIFDLAISGNHEISLIRQIDQQLGHLFSEAVLEVCAQSNLLPSAIKAIGSHGQTIRHHPPSQSQLGYSLQVGDPNIIAERTQITTVADFRRRDIAAGGHGAPLAPGLHNALFRDPRHDRFILNTGGIANITHLPSRNETDITGFDTGPANGLMDSWCQLHTQQPYDNKGEWAASGTVQNTLLQQLLRHPFFSLPFPKSTGREDFNLDWLKKEVTDWGEEARPEDIQATLLALSSTTISHAIIELDPKESAEVFICGGGAHNEALCSHLRESLAPRPFESTSSLGIEPDWVEAVAFAWMAKQTLEYKPANIRTVTGAQKEVILGAIYPA